MNSRKRFSVWLVFSLVIFFALAFSQPVLAAGPKSLDRSYKVVRLVKDTLLAGGNGAQIGDDGALYVMHSGNSSISRIDLKTMKVTKLVHPYSGAFVAVGMTPDGQGNFYVAGSTSIASEVYRIDKNGVKTVIAKLNVTGIQYNKRTGRLFVSECHWGNRVFELDPSGVKEPKLLVKENMIAVPEAFDIDPDTNDLIIPDFGSDKIVRVHPDTGEIKIIAQGFVLPVCVKVGTDKMAYVQEYTGGVYRLGLDGLKKEKLAQLPPGVDNLAITPEGRLFSVSYWDATVFEVARDGSGKFKALFPKGPNQLTGILVKNNKVLVSDGIMIRNVKKDQYEKTKLNAWAAHGMPMLHGLADGPGDQVIWPDIVTNTVTIGDPAQGEFKVIAGGLNRPTAVLMSKSEPKIYVAEYGAGQITEVSLTDGAKTALATGLEGPLALAIIDKTLYVAEAKAGRFSKVDLSSGKKEVFLSSGVVGRVGALVPDTAGNLLALDAASGRLFRINPKNMAISIVAENLPVAVYVIGSYPPVELPTLMTISPKGDIYIPTADRGLIMLQKTK
jgi:sugar lactone lactonase YvrE